MCRHASFGMIKPIEHTQQQHQEGKTYPDYILPHRTGNDKIGALARFVVHHTGTGRNRSQGQGGKGIHNKVHPKHLGHSKWQSRTYQRTQQHNEQSHEIDSELEDNETLYVLYNERPHMTAVPMLLNESSSNVISLASLATEVPVPIESPTCAWFSAGASLVPSPVTATTAPFCCKSCTKRCLSVGRARDIILRSVTRSSASSSVSSAKQYP